MELQQIADDLLTPLWRGLGNDYKHDQTRRGNNVWEQFQENVSAAAYTTDRLTRFLEEIVSLLPIQITEKYVPQMAGVLRSGEDRQILRALRQEAAALIVYVQEANQERNEKLPKRDNKVKETLQKAMFKKGDSDEDIPV